MSIWSTLGQVAVGTVTGGWVAGAGGAIIGGLAGVGGGDPVQGALWSGPPFASTLWRSLTEERNPDSPAWLPRFRNGSFARFMNQDGAAVARETTIAQRVRTKRHGATLLLRKIYLLRDLNQLHAR